MSEGRTANRMRAAPGVALLVVLLAPATTLAGNADEVNAGIDVTLTGGAVVASTYTGAALWYNPAGIARIKRASLEIAGVTLQTQIVRVPGYITVGTDPITESEGKTVNFTVIPEALTFAIVLKENLKLGIGLFNSSIRRSLLTEEVTTAPGVSPEVETVGGRSSRHNFYHVSSGFAGMLGKKQVVLLGGALDFVVGNSRVDSTGVFSYDGGESGFVTEGKVSVHTSFGLQLKAGLQWVPIEEVRVGFSIASPTYAFLLVDRFASTFGQAPPVGMPLPPDDSNAQSASGMEHRGLEGGWWGVEPGNMRLGIAYGGPWGWIEADLVLQWRLRTPDLGIDLKGIVNGRFGSAFRLTRFMKLGLGAFTDRSQVDRIQLAPLATTDIDFYGVHVGFLFSNREVHPDRPDVDRKQKREKIGLSIALGLRYAFGRGDVLGRFVPPQYDPSAVGTFPTSGKVHEIALNVGAKVLF